MLVAFGAVVQKAYRQRTDPEDLAKQAEKIDPTLGKLVRSVSGNRPIYLTGLLLLILAIKSCNLNIDIDVNELIDQMNGVAPTEIALEVSDNGE